jgi:acyl-CoA dehydrogenase
VDFSLNQDQQDIREAVLKHCSQFPDEYWLEKDRSGEFPFEFHKSMAEAGWLGVAMPEAVGGAGLGITEAAVMMQAVAESGGGMTAASAIHGPVFGLEPVTLFGTEEQQKRMIPPILSGEEKMCFAVTEPNTGLDTTSLKTRAEKVPGGYRVNGEKIWITNAHVADRMLLIARTTPLEEVKKKTEGLTLFYCKIDRKSVEHRLIPKMGRHAVGSNMLFITDLFIPEEDRIGEEGQGFKILLQGLNPERVLLGAEATGLGRVAIRKASKYAQERVVFGRPIGQNQGIQFPIARAHAQMEAAALMVAKAAELFDAGAKCGAEANMAKLLASEASAFAADICIQTHGGYGFAEEYDIERKFRETRLYQVAPVSTNLILSYVATHVLGMPKSF